MAVIVALDHRHDVLADLGAPRLAARQDNEIQRVAEFEVRRGLILAPTRVLARNKAGGVGRRFYFRRYPQGEARRTWSATRRSRGPGRAREIAERLLTGTDRRSPTSSSSSSTS